MTSYLLQRSTWWQPRSDDEDGDDSDDHWPHLTQYHWEMTADVASLTACVVVDCCSKTRDSNTPHIRPRRVDPAWPAQRVVTVRTSGVFPPFQGRPASTVATGPGLISHWGHLGAIVWVSEAQEDSGASHQPQTLQTTVSHWLRPGANKVQTGEWNYLNGIIVNQSWDSGAQDIKHADNKTLVWLGPGGGGAGDNRCAVCSGHQPGQETLVMT